MSVYVRVFVYMPDIAAVLTVGNDSGGGRGGEEHRETTHSGAHALVYADGPVGGDLSREVLVESEEGEEEEDGYVHVC